MNALLLAENISDGANYRSENSHGQVVKDWWKGCQVPRLCPYRPLASDMVEWFASSNLLQAIYMTEQEWRPRMHILPSAWSQDLMKYNALIVFLTQKLHHNSDSLDNVSCSTWESSTLTIFLEYILKANSPTRYCVWMCVGFNS